MAKWKPILWEVQENDCWEEVNHARTHGGYPVKMYCGKQIKISRLIYQECFGEIPIGMEVCHKCNNPACINPEHLELGTHDDNMKHKVACGRQSRIQQRGEENGKSKLTEQQILNIRADTRSHRIIAQEYGVSRPTIGAIKNKKYGYWHWL